MNIREHHRLGPLMLGMFGLLATTPAMPVVDNDIPEQHHGGSTKSSKPSARLKRIKRNRARMTKESRRRNR